LFASARSAMGFRTTWHLIGECLFWSMFDDEEEVTTSGPVHFKTAITGALQRTEAALRASYEKATHKTRTRPITKRHCGRSG